MGALPTQSRPLGPPPGGRGWTHSTRSETESARQPQGHHLSGRVRQGEDEDGFGEEGLAAPPHHQPRHTIPASSQRRGSPRNAFSRDPTPPCHSSEPSSQPASQPSRSVVQPVRAASAPAAAAAAAALRLCLLPRGFAPSRVSSVRGGWLPPSVLALFPSTTRALVVRRRTRRGYLVDPASSICLSQRLSHACLSTNGLYSETAKGSLNQLWFL